MHLFRRRSGSQRAATRLALNFSRDIHHNEGVIVLFAPEQDTYYTLAFESEEEVRALMSSIGKVFNSWKDTGESPV